MNTLLEIATTITGVLPNPEPEQPPGTEGVSTLINWLAWGALILGLAGFLHGTDVATSGVVHEDVDATMSSDDLGHCLVMARVSGRALASARITPASC